MNQSEQQQVQSDKPKVGFDGHTVVGTGMIAIHEGYLLGYARSIAGSSFSCYEWSYYHTAHKVSVFKRGETIIVQRA